jgi:ABC-type bacteriocin/lantibiotic exporter with double-glycine peptidase domain
MALSMSAVTLLIAVAGAVGLDASPADGLSSPSDGIGGSCGAESLWAMSQLLGVNVGREWVVSRVGSAGQENSFLELQQAAVDLKVNLVGRRLGYAELCNVQQPVIAHLSWKHFVVVVRADEATVEIIDGFDRHVVMEADVFRRQWSGHVLVHGKRSGRLRWLGATLVLTAVMLAIARRSAK